MANIVLKATIMWDGAIWAEGQQTDFVKEPSRSYIRLMRKDGPFNASEHLVLELDFLPDPLRAFQELETENQRLREKLENLGEH